MKCYACKFMTLVSVLSNSRSDSVMLGGKLGHISRDCSAPNGGPLNTAGKICYQCSEAGHISRDCPRGKTNGDLGEQVDVSVAAPLAPLAPVA
jgi:cellular nucleic acid-binding protein